MSRTLPPGFAFDPDQANSKGSNTAKIRSHQGFPAGNYFPREPQQSEEPMSLTTHGTHNTGGAPRKTQAQALERWNGRYSAPRYSMSPGCGARLLPENIAAIKFSRCRQPVKIAPATCTAASVSSRLVSQMCVVSTHSMPQKRSVV